MILAGDIGGTKTVLALFEPAGDSVRQVRAEVFASREHATLEEILRAFLRPEAHLTLSAGCFGVAGPVIGGRSETTNLPWVLDEQALAACIGTPRVRLLNDLEATAYGVVFVGADELVRLDPGTARRAGNVAVIAAGTGLGEALLYWDGTHYHPIASEGGHADFAPNSDEEIALLQHLRRRFGAHVSYERVLSGPGLANIYAFLRESGAEPEPPWLTAKLTGGDPSATIAEVGLAGHDAVCARTLELFAAIYGAEAGNLALKCVATAVFIGGGIAPKLLPVLHTGTFMRSFAAKGRLSPLLQTVAVHVVLNQRTALLGAAHFALRLSATLPGNAAVA